MDKSLLTLEELSAWEALEIRGGRNVDESTQRGCANSATGCGSGISQPGCTNESLGCGSNVSQNGCSNSAQCACTAPPGGQTSCTTPPPTVQTNCP